MSSKPKITLKVKPSAKPKLRDLRKMKSQVSDTTVNLNENITSVLQKLIDQIKDENRKETDRKVKTSNNFRMKQLRQAIATLTNHPDAIDSGASAMKLKGIGKGIGQRIDTILETGTLPDELKTDSGQDEEVEAVRDLSTVTGIGEAHALTFYRKFGIRSVSDLQKKFKAGEIKLAKNQLTHHMVIGLKYYDDFNTRIPRDEITESSNTLDQVIKHLQGKHGKGLKYLICGSYRRELKSSGDMDVLITSPKYQTYEELHGAKVRVLSELVEYLTQERFLIDHLTQDIATKYMGVCQIRDLARRIDIRMVAHESWPSAMLYFTGSGAFNVRMRNVALSQGYTLNEYGLYPLKNGQKGTPVKVASEKDIFETLGLMYIEPKERI